MKKASRSTARLLGLATFSMLVSGSVAAARPALPAGVTNPTAKSQTAPVYAMVELSAASTAVQFAQQKAVSGAFRANAAAVSQIAVVRSEQAAFDQRLVAAKLPGMKEIYRLQRVINGILYRTPSSNLAALRQIPGVKAVHLVTPQVPDNSNTIPLIGVPSLWAAGLAVHGEGIKVGVIDTGI